MSNDALNEMMPEEDLQAALAEIESMSPEELDAIPDLGDGRDEPDEGGGPDVSDPSLGGEELEAALAELETLSAPQGGGEDGGGPKKSAGKPGGGGPKPRFQVGKKAAPKEEPQRAPEPVEATEPTGAAALVLRGLDVGLAVANRPFARISASWRAVVGQLALATIGVSLASVVVLPMLLPKHDAISFVRAKRAALERGELAIPRTGLAALETAASQADEDAASNAPGPDSIRTDSTGTDSTGTDAAAAPIPAGP